MKDLLMKYIRNNETSNALLVGQNLFYKDKGNKEIFDLYFNLLLNIAEQNPLASDKYIEQAINVLSLYSENVQIDEHQVVYIRDCENKLNACVSKIQDFKEQEHVKALKRVITKNDEVLSLIKVIIRKLNAETDRAKFDILLVELSERDLELNKEQLVTRQKNEYDLLTKQCQKIIDAKLKEFERIENVKYNQEAVAAYERIFNVFKDPQNTTYHPNQIIELFTFDSSRLFNETLIYYNHVYNFILSKLSDEEKLAITKLAIIAEKKR